jgi:hypothetical protein
MCIHPRLKHALQQSADIINFINIYFLINLANFNAKTIDKIYNENIKISMSKAEEYSRIIRRLRLIQ